MRGDILIIGDHHRQAADDILELILPQVRLKPGKFIISVAGESGAGKSELACAMEGKLEKMDIRAYIIQQDDYFVFPPKTNERTRVIDINRVGPTEVRLDLLNDNIKAVLDGQSLIEKPLVIFAEDRITSENIDLEPFRVIIVDGTYTTLLEHLDCRIFIDRDWNDTREDRLRRNRENQNAYLENILEIEHNVISRHKEMADIIVDKEFRASKPL
jgi:uridine kinase